MKTLTLIDVHVSSELWEKKFDIVFRGRLAPAVTGQEYVRVVLGQLDGFTDRIHHEVVVGRAMTRIFDGHVTV